MKNHISNQTYSKNDLGKQVLIPQEIHSKVKIFAAINGLLIPEAYSELVLLGLSVKNIDTERKISEKVGA